MHTQSFIFNSSISVSFQNNGYLNATAIAAHFGKLVGNYLRNERTQEYISALAENLSVMRNRITDKNELVIKKQGGTEQGTWLHPKLAVDFARWLDPKFAVWCDSKIEEILGIGFQDIQSGYLNETERAQIRTAVKERCTRTGESTQAVYLKLHAYMETDSYFHICREDFQRAMQFLASIADAPTLFSQFDEMEIARFATVAYYCKWACSLLKEVARPLRALGYDKACTMQTLAEESTSFLKNSRQTLERELPNITDPYYRDHIKNSLHRFDTV